MALLRCLLLLSVALTALGAQQPATRNVEAQLSEAGALVQAGRLEDAEAATRKIVNAYPRNAEAHSLLGVILDQRGQTAEAEKQYDAALRLQPKLVSALSNLGVLLARTNRTSEAIAKFEEVLRIDPKHERAAFNLGSLYAARGDYKRAVPLLEKTAGAAALFTLALKLAEAREYTEAVRLFQRTNELRPQTYEVLYNLRLALYNLDRLDEAQKVMTSASALSPNEADPYYRLGLIASAQGDTKAALRQWARALELRPVFAEANFMIAEELLKNKLAEKSIPFYEKALEQSQGQLVYFLRLGVANVRGQHYDRAREVFTKALERYPNNPNLYFLLGYAGRAEGQYDQAVTAFQQALKLQPDNADAIANLGYIASQRGENVEAERLLRRAIELDPKAFPSYHDLGRLLVKLR